MPDHVQRRHGPGVDWERVLRAEGLAPLDRTVGRRTFVKTEIVVPLQYLDEPERLRDALAQWLGGDETGFTPAGRRLLVRGIGRQWQSEQPICPLFAGGRARILMRFCEALAAGVTVAEAATVRGERDLAYDFLRPLARQLAHAPAQIDDDQPGDDGHHG